MSRESNVLCVDLDGTLTRTDTLWESFLLLVKRNPLYLFRLPFWLAEGKSALKHEIASRVELNVKSLPYSLEFLSYLVEEQRAGRKLVLCTASNEKIARAVAEHIGIFSEVIASDRDYNLSGSTKARHLVDRFGVGSFDYAGNELRDKVVIDAARSGILVNPSSALTRAMEGTSKVARVFRDDNRNVGALAFRAMRPHQWSKNLLLFVPLAASHNLNQLDLLQATVAGFVAFCLCASSTYILNDLLDLDADRKHRDKKERPFATGGLSIVSGLSLSLVLLTLSFGLAFLQLLIAFVAMLALYYIATLFYSVWLKAIPILDVLLLSILYTIRVIAGAVAIAVEPSFWLLAFSVFLFLSLANVKRYAELLATTTPERPAALGRGYSHSDLGLLAMLGTASGYLSVMVLALYLNSPDVVEMYAIPEAIWLLCPIQLYWISRIWMKTCRGQLKVDPVVFAISDPMSYLLAIVSSVILFVATG